VVAFALQPEPIGVRIAAEEPARGSTSDDRAAAATDRARPTDGARG
jgi:hypothetical protein